MPVDAGGVGGVGVTVPPSVEPPDGFVVEPSVPVLPPLGLVVPPLGFTVVPPLGFAVDELLLDELATIELAEELAADAVELTMESINVPNPISDDTEPELTVAMAGTALFSLLHAAHVTNTNAAVIPTATNVWI